MPQNPLHHTPSHALTSVSAPVILTLSEQSESKGKDPEEANSATTLRTFQPRSSSAVASASALAYAVAVAFAVAVASSCRHPERSEGPRRSKCSNNTSNLSAHPSSAFAVAFAVAVAFAFAFAFAVASSCRHPDRRGRIPKKQIQQQHFEPFSHAHFGGVFPDLSLQEPRQPFLDTVLAFVQQLRKIRV